VIDMVSLGLPDEVIIDKIHAVTAWDFDTSVPGLRDLKAAKVSDAIIRLMINPSPSMNSTSGPSSPTATSEPVVVSEVGVYSLHNGKRTDVQPEIVNWQTGGVLKSHASLGIVKGDINGRVMRARSPTQMTNPLEFLIKTSEGTSVEEYQLLRLHEKGDRREFRSVTGGILHVSGGAQRDELDFQPEKIGNRIWRIVLRNLPSGEYGFLPPGLASASISASGKMYTFRVVEADAANDVQHASQSQQPVDTSTASPTVSSAQAATPGTIGASSDENPTVRHDGVTLSRVRSGSPADQVGLRIGDVILAIDNHYLFTAQELNDEVSRHKPGTKIAVRYRRYSTIYGTSLVVGAGD
jgi:hypothetical protein